MGACQNLSPALCRFQKYKTTWTTTTNLSFPQTGKRVARPRLVPVSEEINGGAWAQDSIRRTPPMVRQTSLLKRSPLAESSCSLLKNRQVAEAPETTKAPWFCRCTRRALHLVEEVIHNHDTTIGHPVPHYFKSILGSAFTQQGVFLQVKCFEPGFKNRLIQIPIDVHECQPPTATTASSKAVRRHSGQAAAESLLVRERLETGRSSDEF